MHGLPWSDRGYAGLAYVGDAENPVGVPLGADQENAFGDTASPPRERHEVAVPLNAAVGVHRSSFACITCQLTVNRELRCVSLRTNQGQIVLSQAIELVETNSELIRLEVRVPVAGDPLRNHHVVKDRRGRNELDVGVLLLERLLEGREPVLLVRLETGGPAGEPVLVADLDILDVPRLRVTEGGADSTPLGGFGIARQEFELVEGVLNSPADLRLGEEVTVQGKTSPDTKDCEVLVAVFSSSLWEKA